MAALEVPTLAEIEALVRRLLREELARADDEAVSPRETGARASLRVTPPDRGAALAPRGGERGLRSGRLLVERTIQRRVHIASLIGRSSLDRPGG